MYQVLIENKAAVEEYATRIEAVKRHNELQDKGIDSAIWDSKGNRMSFLKED